MPGVKNNFKNYSPSFTSYAGGNRAYGCTFSLLNIDVVIGRLIVILGVLFIIFIILDKV